MTETSRRRARIWWLAAGVYVWWMLYAAFTHSNTIFLYAIVGALCCARARWLDAQWRTCRHIWFQLHSTRRMMDCAKAGLDYEPVPIWHCARCGKASRRF